MFDFDSNPVCHFITKNLHVLFPIISLVMFTNLFHMPQCFKTAQRDDCPYIQLSFKRKKNSVWDNSVSWMHFLSSPPHPYVVEQTNVSF